MSFYTVLALVNAIAIVAILGYIIFRVVRLKRNKEPQPENLTPFFDDEVLEGAHLERVLGVALIALIIVVLGLLAYFIWEPFRETASASDFHEQSVARGATLFANAQSKAYDSTKSLLCADCHGGDGGGGTAKFVVQSDDPRCNPTAPVTDQTPSYCLPQQVAWAAPNLQLAPLRYSREQLTQIITYGRPGTPMPAWGVASGKGALQEQSIQDLVNYVESLATTSTKAQLAGTSETKSCGASDPVNSRAACVGRKQLEDPATQAAADKWVVSAQADLAAAEAERNALPATASADERATYDKLVQQKQEGVQVAENWQQTTRSASDGAILFMNNCARCHTRGWSYFDATDPQGNPPPGIMGGGAYGPNLTNGDVNNQFPPPSGESQLQQWISIGVPANEQYGIRGISSGRMPHFGAVLSKQDIEAIMAYERSL
jgi:mono/diheme cytochrome c family protein